MKTWLVRIDFDNRRKSPPVIGLYKTKATKIKIYNNKY